MTENIDAKFSLVIGGPFHRLLSRLALLGPDLLPYKKTALLFVALAWVPPAILTMSNGDLPWDSNLGNRSYFIDFAAYARYTIAIWLFFHMEHVAEVRLNLLIHQFSATGIIPSEEFKHCVRALKVADRRSSSTIAEIVVLGLAFLTSLIGFYLTLTIIEDTWLGNLDGSHLTLTPAGWWAVFVSLPLFWFLFLRWIWRFVVWTLLLNSLAKLKLRLVANHPDRCGGLGFLSLYPPTFSTMVFALSCVTASGALVELMFGGGTLDSLVTPFLVWLLIVLIIFIGPLAVFSSTLIRLRQRALLEYGELACKYSHAIEEASASGKEDEKAMSVSDEISTLADLATNVEVIRDMKTIPVDINTYIPLVIAVALPWLIVVLTQLPLADLVTAILKTFL